MTMGYRAPSKKAIKDAIALMKDPDSGQVGVPPVLRFWSRVQETSLFGPESKVPGQNVVVGPDAYTDRRWYATLTVDEHGTVVGIR